MKRDKRDNSIIPKIIVFLGTLSILGIILLFFRQRPGFKAFSEKPKDPRKLFTQVLKAAEPAILKLWTQGDTFLKKTGPNCPEEINFQNHVGRSYYQCQPHLWQCYWQGGIAARPSLEIDIFGQIYHIRARASFPSIKEFSIEPRYYQNFTKSETGLPVHKGILVELEIDEIPNFSSSLILTDVCRDTYLPQRIYPYGKNDSKKKKEEGFIWDNFDRNIFIDKFYVTNQMLNDWYLTFDKSKLILDRIKWPEPAFINLSEQKKYCASIGKRVLEATLFDAATMSPSDTRIDKPERVSRPQTPWQRDLSKTFLGMSRINPDYQLTPLDCQLAQVKECPKKIFSTDSSTWMGLNFALGFFPESLVNTVEPEKNLKQSSQFLNADSDWHELGVRTYWDGIQKEAKDRQVAFRCYEEVAL